MGMKQIISQSRWGILLMGIALADCTGTGTTEPLPEKPIHNENEMVFRAVHPGASRATATAFEENDRIGVFLTEAGEELEQSGNYVNNASLTYRTGEWQGESPIYWDNRSYDVYAYFPYIQRVSSVDDYPFAVATDQRKEGYAASDFLWAGKKNAQASEGAVTLPFRHCMSRLKVRLVAGEDYEGELPNDVTLYIHNTVTEATIDLAVGIPTRNQYASARTVIARDEGNHTYGAILVPQRLLNRLPLLEVVTEGVSYLMESTFVFKQGICHNVTLILSKNPEQVKIEIGGEIEDWG